MKLIHNMYGKRLYRMAKDLPIADYHCHLSPREIYEDLPFDNIGQVWLGADHYKWRLMRSAGVEERFITEEASWKEKFVRYIGALEMSPGNPLYLWSGMELEKYFGITTPLRRENADAIWERANAVLKKKGLSPRKLILSSRVEALCTTDDITDSLEWHGKLKKEFPVRVLPSYRTDKLLLMRAEGYHEYIDKLARASGVAIENLAGLKRAARSRLEAFVAAGCRVADVGIPIFPDRIADETEAEETFACVLRGETIPDGAYKGLLGNLYVFFAELYAEYNLLSQWHLSVVRNANTALYAMQGADCGGDCVGSGVASEDIIRILDGAKALPETVIYTLDGAATERLASVAGSFPRVHMGAAWWFCDHKRGIGQVLDTVAENGCLGEFLGMLTDSRSFLSYARHDYFRRILCDKIGGWVESGEYDAVSAERLVRKICYENSRRILE